MIINIEIILYSIVQGLTEFLPISSSAHLYFIEELFSWKSFGVLFALAAHLGTLLAVILHQRKMITKIILVDCFKNRNYNLIKVIAISIAPIMVFGFLLATVLEKHYSFNLLIIGSASVVGGLLLGFSDKKKTKNVKLINLKINKIIFIAFFQSLALIPGFSRSGTLITAMRFLGFNRKDSISFSLLTGIPIILSATIYGIYSIIYSETILVNTFFLITLFSFLSAYFSIKFILSWIKKFTFKIFVYYRVFYGLLLICYYFSY